ncbi:MAG: hypothetical protein ACR2NA_03800 [Solirubrobacterales bacterium]|jgi:hypothetical protein
MTKSAAATGTMVVAWAAIATRAVPASGKSTMAPAISRKIGLLLIAKDTIKDALMSVLPVPDVETSRRVGKGAVAAMLAVAAESPIGAVIESNFYRHLGA